LKDPVWNKYLIERDRELWDAAGYGTRQGFGKRPVILIIDVNYAFTGDRREPILESIKRWPNSCGEDAWEAMRHIKRLLDAARAKGLPVIYTTNDWRADRWDAASWRWKGRRPREMRANAEGAQTDVDGNEINAEIAPQSQDIIIRKLKPSGFHGTPLTSLLVNFKADSLIVAGTSTSGCVRATVIDAFSENYRVAVVEEGCFDRFRTSHAINLCDIHAKYGDVIGIDEAVEFTGGLPDDLFDLPSGTPL
jgi:nicotinamidase-related amidase